MVNAQLTVNASFELIAKRQRSFEPYFTTRGDQGGAGLGLAMVYGFVRQSGGEAQIFSRQGEGTTVQLSFPVKSDAE